MTAPERKIPAFFKVYVPKFSSVRMQIPPGFACYMKGKLTDTPAFLRDSRGNVWAVEVSRESRDLYFEKGWVRFVEDNNVEMGDFLVFKFNGDYFYDFKHLGKSCCQKETVGSFKFTVKAEELYDEDEDDDDVEDEEYDEEEEDEDEDDNEDEY